MIEIVASSGLAEAIGEQFELVELVLLLLLSGG